jgi:hypothetical protein
VATEALSTAVYDQRVPTFFTALLAPNGRSEAMAIGVQARDRGPDRGLWSVQHEGNRDADRPVCILEV